MSDWFDDLPIEVVEGGKKKMPVDFNINWRKGGMIGLIALFLLVLIVFQPWFTVGPGEVGVVLRLGKMNRIVSPGFHFRLPRPIEVVYTPNIRLQRRIEIGFRSNSDNPGATARDVAVESIMLTGDENIIVAKMIIQYKISDPAKYLFNIYDVENTLTDISEAALRQVIGDYPIESALTGQRDQLQIEIQKIIEEISDQYEIGLLIDQVQLQETHAPDPVEPAFADVFNAREDQARIEREAEAYQNKEMPKAEGAARKILQEAASYSAERIAKSKGEVERFSAILKEYENAPQVTRQRLYLETMEKVLAEKSKVIVDSDDGLLKLLNVTPNDLGLSKSLNRKESN